MEIILKLRIESLPFLQTKKQGKKISLIDQSARFRTKNWCFRQILCFTQDKNKDLGRKRKLPPSYSWKSTIISNSKVSLHFSNIRTQTLNQCYHCPNGKPLNNYQKMFLHIIFLSSFLIMVQVPIPKQAQENFQKHLIPINLLIWIKSKNLANKLWSCHAAHAKKV